MDNKLYEGCNAMIIGSFHPDKQNNVGKMVKLIVYIPRGGMVVYDGELWAASETDDGWVVEGQDLLSMNGMGEVKCCAISSAACRHLMPLPPLEDPGIDDCTFTPIKNQQPVNA